MNREAIRYYFEEVAEVSYDEKEEGFVVRSTSIESDTLSEIGACKGSIEDHDMYGQFWVVDDE